MHAIRHGAVGNKAYSNESHYIHAPYGFSVAAKDGAASSATLYTRSRRGGGLYTPGCDRIIYSTTGQPVDQLNLFQPKM